MECILSFIRGVTPTNMEVHIGAIWATIGTVLSVAMGWNEVLEALIYIMVLDYITGVVSAYVNPDLALNSQRGFKGIAKKVLILCLVSLGCVLDWLTGKEIMQYAVMWFFISNEGLSIIENVAKAGVPIPSKLKDSLEQLASEKKAKYGGQGKEK